MLARNIRITFPYLKFSQILDERKTERRPETSANAILTEDFVFLFEYILSSRSSKDVVCRRKNKDDRARDNEYESLYSKESWRISVFSSRYRDVSRRSEKDDQDSTTWRDTDCRPPNESVVSHRWNKSESVLTKSNFDQTRNGSITISQIDLYNSPFTYFSYLLTYDEVPDLPHLLMWRSTEDEIIASSNHQDECQ